MHSHRDVGCCMHQEAAPACCLHHKHRLLSRRCTCTNRMCFAGRTAKKAVGNASKHDRIVIACCSFVCHVGSTAAPGVASSTMACTCRKAHHCAGIPVRSQASAHHASVSR